MLMSSTHKKNQGISSQSLHTHHAYTNSNDSTLGKHEEDGIFTPNGSSFSGEEQPEHRSALPEHFNIKIKE